MLDYNIDDTTYDSLSEPERALYKKTDNGYQAQIGGVVEKTKLDEFRATNVELLKAQEKFKDIDLDKYNAALEAEKQLREEQLIKDKDFDTLFKERAAALESDYQAKIKNLETELDSSKSGYSSLISKHEIEGAANSAFIKYKISPEAQQAVLAQVKSKFSINNGAVLAMDGEKIETGANGNLTIDEFVAGMPEIFKVQSNGGRGNGGSANNITSRSSSEKIAGGLGKLLGAKS